MERDIEAGRLDRLFSQNTGIALVIGLCINAVLANVVKFLGLPLYIDNIGTILVGALCGPIPGMAVGFLTNVVNSIGDPISMYYAVLSVFIALSASFFSAKGWLRTVRGCLILTGITVLIGGGCGSIMTWFLYGGGISGVSSPIGTMLQGYGMPDFYCQVLADIIVDIPDKCITMLAAFAVLQTLPERWLRTMVYGDFYIRKNGEYAPVVTTATQRHVSRRITGIIAISVGFIAAVSIFYLTTTFQRSIRDQYGKNALNAATLVANLIDGDELEAYEAGTSPDYDEIKEHITDIYRGCGVEFLYVYRLTSDRCYVVFDVDTKTVKASPQGSTLPWDADMEKYKESLLSGKGFGENQYTIGNSSFGYLITAYAPITNSSGQVVAYAGADVLMDTYLKNMEITIIRVIALIFGISLFICSMALWYATLRISRPISTIVAQSRAFEKTPINQWLKSQAWIDRTVIDTEDEIQELYLTVSNSQEMAANTVSQMAAVEKQLREAAEIEQENKILTKEIHEANAERHLKNEFYSNMSHDMRTPMNGIIGLVNLSEEEMDPTVLRDNIDKIGMSANYLLSLINDTLDMSKIENKKMRLEPTPVSLDILSANINDMVHQSIEDKGIHYTETINMSNKPVAVMVDAVRVKQIVINLLNNAIKFTPIGGKIDVALTEKILSPKRRQYTLVVADSGCGMTEDFVKNRLFTPFEQETNPITITSAGSGLGLSIVKNLVELMDGTIDVESTLGKGTCFTVTMVFDVVEDPKTEKTDTPLAMDTSSLKGCHVLVCEDHPLNAEIVRRLLDKQGMVVTHAENGAVGINCFESAAEGTFDAILMDVRMPVMDGLLATRAIRKIELERGSTPLPIIAMTANVYAEDRASTKAAGMNAHLAKPITPDVLYATLIRLIGANKNDNAPKA